MDTKILGTIGKCIYCNSTSELTDEHIIPYGLGGPWVLKKASCKKCATLTSHLEFDVLRGPYLRLRASQKLPTRRSLPSNFTIEAKFKSNNTTSELPITPDYLPVSFPMYDPPAYYDGRSVAKGVTITGLHSIIVNPNLEQHLKNKGVTEITASTTFKGGSFERMICKIAYGYAVATYGLDNIKEKYILPIIMGTDEEICRYFGCESTEMTISPLYHRIRTEESGGLIVGKVQLFGVYGTPIYSVIIGHL